MKGYRRVNKSKKRNNRTVQSTREINSSLRTLTVVGQNDAFVRLPPIPDPPEMKVAKRQIHNFVRTVSLGQLYTNSSSLTGNPLSFVFQLDNLPNSGDFINLFDQYRFVQICVTFTPTLSLGSVNTYTFNPIYTCIDIDDNIPPTSVTDVQQFQTCQINKVGSQFSRVFSPRFASAAYASGAFASYAQSIYGQWIDMNSPSVQYYGIKGWVGGSDITSTQIYEVDARVHLQCARVR